KAQIEVVFRMLKAYYTKEYRGVATRTLGLLVLGVLYFVLPGDFIPDFIPVVGHSDDLTVIMAIFKSLNTDIEKFLEWERTKPQCSLLFGIRKCFVTYVIYNYPNHS